MPVGGGHVGASKSHFNAQGDRGKVNEKKLQTLRIEDELGPCKLKTCKTHMAGEKKQMAEGGARTKKRGATGSERVMEMRSQKNNDAGKMGNYEEGEGKRKKKEATEKRALQQKFKKII